jgi:histidine triad (HIT) family protein
VKSCIFCEIAAGTARSRKVYADERVCAFFDINPVSIYHTLVIPKNHYQDIFELPEQELLAVMAVVKKLVDLYHDQLGIKNVQIIHSSGAEAQQDVFHVHFHIVPRHEGDDQDIRWKTHPEWVKQFDQWLEKLRAG